jgi:DNA-binding transcriptional ArsR family regulator
MSRRSRSDENALLLALRHPLRRRILRELDGREPTSPRELAELLDQPLSNLSYHVRVLAECGAAKLVRTEPARGSTQHFYAATVVAPWARQVLGLGDVKESDPGESSGGAVT